MSSGNSNSSILRGHSANLSVLRAAFQFQKTDGAVVAQQAALSQFLEAEEQILHSPLLVTSQQQSSDTIPSPRETRGQLVITTERVLFWSDSDSQGLDSDLVVPAECIDLHALSSSSPMGEVADSDDDDHIDTKNGSDGTHHDQSNPPVTSLYLQIRSDGDSSDPGFIEWTVIPYIDAGDNDDRDATTQALFEALSQLITFHPINPNMDDDDFDCDEMVFAPSLLGREATPDEQDAMLERLDAILVVPPELEQSDVIEGQFDDADEDQQFDDDDDNGLL